MAMVASVAALPCRGGLWQGFGSVKPSSGGGGSLGVRGVRGVGRRRRPGGGGVVGVRCYVRQLRPVEERFRIQVERNVGEARLEELGVGRWSKWESDVCSYEHEWTVDEQVYVVKGSVRVIPEDCEDSAYFYAGDVVRFPKWFCGTLSFEGEYEQRYRFLAYGDD